MFDDYFLTGLASAGMEDSLMALTKFKMDTLRRAIEESVYTAKDAHRLDKKHKVYVANTMEEMIANIMERKEPVHLDEVLDESNGKCFVVDGMRYTYACVVELEEPQKMCSHRELARWLAKGRGEYKYADASGLPEDAVRNMSTTDYRYGEADEDEPVSNILVRKWRDTVWHEPTVQYMQEDTMYPRFLLSMYTALEKS